MAGPHAALAVVNMDYFICARAVAQQPKTPQKAAAFALIRLPAAPPHGFLADLCLLFCHPDRRKCCFLFFSEKTRIKTTPARNEIGPYAVVLRSQSSNSHVAGISEGWEAEGSPAAKAVRAGVPRCFCSHSVAYWHGCPGAVWLWAKAPRGMGLLRQLSNEPCMGQLTSHQENVGGCLFLNKKGITANFLMSA